MKKGYLPVQAAALAGFGRTGRKHSQDFPAITAGEPGSRTYKTSEGKGRDTLSGRHGISHRQEQGDPLELTRRHFLEAPPGLHGGQPGKKAGRR